MKTILHILIITLCAASPLIAGYDAQIKKIQSILEIDNEEPAGSLFFFDIDDTLIDSPSMLGSKAWRKYIIEATKDYPGTNWLDIFSLYVAKHHPVVAVEVTTSQFIKALQEKGYAVFGLTARERAIWYDTPVDGIDLLTVSQLHNVEIDLHNEALESTFPLLTSAPEYFKGIFFADVEPKGQYLLKLLHQVQPLPKKILFIDDKQSQSISVAAALSQLGIDCACYWYCAVDEKADKFDPLIANIQLYYLIRSNGYELLSDEMAHGMAQLHPDRDADFYLHKILLLHLSKSHRDVKLMSLK